MPTNNKLKKCFDEGITEDLAHSTKLLDIRERMQYSTRTSSGSPISKKVY